MYAELTTGFSGYIVFLDTNTGRIIHIENFPRNAKRLYEIFDIYKPVYTVVEEVFMSAGFKHVASTNYEIAGRYKQVLDMLDLKYDFARAVTWRKKLNIKAKGRDAQKAASIEKASEIFSKEDFEALHTEFGRIDKVLHKRVKETLPDDNKCESALIAYYALLLWKEKQ